jgi:hypothetical protein
VRDHKDFGSYSEPEYGPMIDVQWKDRNGRIQKFHAPEWARIKAFKKGIAEPTIAKVWWEEIYPDVDRAPLVRRMPRLMLAKCAKAQATRTSYPATGGLLIQEETYSREFQQITPAGRIYRETTENQLPAQLDENAVVYRYAADSKEGQQERESFSRVQNIDKRINELRAQGVPMEQAAAQAEKESLDGQKAPETPPRPQEPAIQKAKPVPTMKFRGAVEIDYTGNSEQPAIRGDIADIVPQLQEKFPSAFWAPDSFWRIPKADVYALGEALANSGYQVKIIAAKDSAGQKSAMTPAGTTTAGRGSELSAGKEPAPGVVSGTVERVVPDVKYAVITLATKDGKKPTWKCFDKDISEILRKNLGKLAEVILQTRISKGVTYTNLIGLKNVAGQEYEDLKVPVIQTRDREAGARTLFP